jgi:hypothetical protein
MKRVLSIAFIVAYLGTLNFGILCHMLGYATASHPLMYFIVWDMFCGWSAYDARAYVVDHFALAPMVKATREFYEDVESRISEHTPEAAVVPRAR